MKVTYQQLENKSKKIKTEYIRYLDTWSNIILKLEGINAIKKLHLC